MSDGPHDLNKLNAMLESQHQHPMSETLDGRLVAAAAAVRDDVRLNKEFRTYIADLLSEASEALAALAALARPAAGERQWVPKELTDKMIDAGDRYAEGPTTIDACANIKLAWAAMLAAAPAPPAPPEQGEWRAAVEQMLAWERAGGDGWWRGWEMLKAAYAAPAPPAQGELEAALAEIIREAEQQEAAPQAGVTEQMVKAAAAALYCELDGDASTWDREGENKIVYRNAARAALEAAAQIKRRPAVEPSAKSTETSGVGYG